LEQHPAPAVRHAIVRHATFAVPSPMASPTIHEPIIGGKKGHDSSYTVQTTSFLDSTDGSVDKKIRRWNNIYADRREIVNVMGKVRKYPLTATSSTGFQVLHPNNTSQQQQPLKSTAFTPILEQGSFGQREESPLNTVKEPVFDQLPPKKPPRTFKNEHRHDRTTPANDQKVPSSSSSSNSSSPSYDYGMRNCL
jgi:hypothetical protein